MHEIPAGEHRSEAVSASTGLPLPCLQCETCNTGRKSHRSRCCGGQLLCQVWLHRRPLLHNALRFSPSHYHDSGVLHVLCTTTQPFNVVTTRSYTRCFKVGYLETHVPSEVLYKHRSRARRIKAQSLIAICNLSDWRKIISTDQSSPDLPIHP